MVTAYFTSQQLLLFAFDTPDTGPTAWQRQTVVTAYFTSQQLLLFAFYAPCGLTRANLYTKCFYHVYH